MSILRVKNLVTGSMLVGVVPKIKVTRLPCEQAHNRFFEGRHRGPNLGSGKKHIWIKHQIESPQMGIPDEEQVGDYVTRMLRSGFGPNHKDGFKRRLWLQAVNRPVGIAVPECRRPSQSRPIVSVHSQKQAHGNLVGTVRHMCVRSSSISLAEGSETTRSAPRMNPLPDSPSA